MGKWLISNWKLTSSYYKTNHPHKWFRQNQANNMCKPPLLISIAAVETGRHVNINKNKQFFLMLLETQEPLLWCYLNRLVGYYWKLEGGSEFTCLLHRSMMSVDLFKNRVVALAHLKLPKWFRTNVEFEVSMRHFWQLLYSIEVWQ